MPTIALYHDAKCQKHIFDNESPFIPRLWFVCKNHIVTFVPLQSHIALKRNQQNKLAVSKIFR